jgi:deferrochelatase/peroxidase EfeB
VTDESGGTSRLGGIPRRALLAAAAVAAVPVAAAIAPSAGAAAFHGPHQPGIATPPLPFLSLAAFDLQTSKRAELERLLQTWSTVGARLSTAERTVTLGIGPSLFDLPIGLADRRPAALQPLPAFRGEAIEASASNGDLCLQVCAATPDAAANGLRALVNAARPLALLRWRQVGYRAVDGTADPRGSLGFRDGTVNLDAGDPARTAQHLWAGDDGPDWMRGGSYLVVRRIRLLLDTWDRTRLADQESLIGRTRAGNQRLAAAAPEGHAQLAAPSRNGGATMLRRSYTYDAGVDVNGLQDSGLIFVAFSRDPGRQFVPVQQRLAANDGMNAFSQHTASGLFACPPGCAGGSWLGAELVA